MSLSTSWECLVMAFRVYLENPEWSLHSQSLNSPAYSLSPDNVRSQVPGVSTNCPWWWSSFGAFMSQLTAPAQAYPFSSGSVSCLDISPSSHPTCAPLDVPYFPLHTKWLRNTDAFRELKVSYDQELASGTMYQVLPSASCQSFSATGSIMPLVSRPPFLILTLSRKQL